MKFCIDDANVEKIRRIYEYYPIDGVSTNPSILAKTGRDPYEVLKEIRSIIGEDGELFVQATAATAEGMVEEARRIVEVLGRSTLVKIPCNPEGFKAMKQLKKEGIRFIGTAIYTAMQGFLAAKCGAEYVAPYVNRIDNMGFDGVQVAKDIHDTITSTIWALTACRSQRTSTIRSRQTALTAAFWQRASRTASRFSSLRSMV